MGSFDRYVIRMTATAFLGTLFAVTAVFWVTQTLRQLDLITSQGQSFWTFLIVTLLAAPSIALVVAPIALFGAVVFVLNRLNADSELPVLSAAGMTPFRLMRPFLIVTVFVAALVGVLSISSIPATLRTIREMVTAIRADVVVNVLREGTFTQLEQNVTVHVRSREAGATLIGILIEDGRDPKQDLVYTAERGRVVRTDKGTYLLLEKGAIQRKEQGADNASIVSFESYAFDLSPLADIEKVITYRPREQYISALWNPPDGNQASLVGRFRSELHDRLVGPLYPVAAMCIAFAALGRPRTTRQNRLTGVATAIGLVALMRIAGFAMTNVASNDAAMVPLLYAVPLTAIVAATAFSLGLVDRLRWWMRSPRRVAA